jgi:hypothetical protein
MNGGRKMHTEIWWVNLETIDHLEDRGIDERIIPKCVLME